MKTISSILRETREKKELTLEEVERATKIKKKYLRDIELGNFHKLPSESYAQGFVKNYAKFLGVPEKQVSPLFRREYSSKHSIHIIPDFRKTQTKFNKSFIFNSKTLLAALAVFIIVIYFLFQYSSLLFPPKLSITSPKSGAELSGNIIEVTGKTDPYATVEIDGEEVYVNLQGVFRKSIYMFSGETKIEVVARNRFGKETTKALKVRVK